MENSFPFKSSVILTISELMARGFGLLFAAKLLPNFGAPDVIHFRSLLPILTVGLAFGTIGIPTALTRILSMSRTNESTGVPSGVFAISGFQVALSCCVFLACLVLVQGMSHSNQWGQFTQSTLYLIAGLAVLLCLNGPMRGVLFGFGDTVTPAIAPLLDVVVRLLCVTNMPHFIRAYGIFSGGLDVLLCVTICGELTVTLLYVSVLIRLYSGFGLSHKQAHSQTLQDPRLSRTVFRLAVGSSLQATVAGLAYAIEIPLAIRFLSNASNPSLATTQVAEYAAVCLPILCAPMVISDGLALALLPAVSTQPTNSGRVRTYLAYVLRIVCLVAIPYMAVLWTVGVQLTAWFGLQGPNLSANVMLTWLTVIVLPLYLQSPISAITLAIGRTRHLIFAGLMSDAVKISTMWFLIDRMDFSYGGLILSFMLSNLLYTSLLIIPLYKRMNLALLWTSLLHAGQAGILVAAVLTTARHVGSHLSFKAHPLVWGVISLGCIFFVYRLNGELPRGLGRAFSRTHAREPFGS